MGTTLNKLEYLDATKGQIKTALNQFGSQITDETTFRDYVDKINDIYNNWGKITDEGTDVTLTGIKKAKMQITTKGNSTQETTTGKNLFNPSLLESGNINTSTGEPSSTGNYVRTSDYISVEANTKYSYQYITQNTAKQIVIYQYDENKSFITFIVIDSASGTRQTGATTSYIKIRFQTSSQDITTVSNIQIEKSASVTDYEQYTGGIPAPNPTFPESIKSVTGNNIITIKNSDNTQSQTLPLNLGTIELNKIGTYQDYIYKNNGNWYKKEQIGKATLGNASQIQPATDIFGVQKKYIMFREQLKQEGTRNYNFFCDKVSPSNGVATNYTGFFANGYFCIIVDDNDILTDLNNMFADAVVYYKNNTITDTEITDSTLIEQLENINKATSYNDTTIITSTYTEDNAQMIINASALKKGSE